MILKCQPYQQTLQEFDAPDTLFYLDPPYPDNGVNYGHNMTSRAAHAELDRVLRDLKGQWLLSSYDREGIRTLYSSHRQVHSLSSASGMRSAAGGRVTNHELLLGS